MINLDSEELASVFQALANDARREMLRKLAEGPANVGELNVLFDMSAPAVSRHLRLLEAAGLIVRERRGTQHFIALDTDPLEAVGAFVESLRTGTAPRPGQRTRKTTAAPSRTVRPKPAPSPEPVEEPPPIWDPEEDEIAKLL